MKNNGDILRHQTLDFPWRNQLYIYDYVQLKVEAIPDSKLHFLPMHQCEACMDVGCVSCYPDKQYKWIFYCSVCHTHWIVKYSEVERSKSV